MDFPSRLLPILVCLAFAGSVTRGAATAPTLTNINNVAGGDEDAVTQISYASLFTASNAHDADGDTMTFRFKSLIAGTLTKGGSPVALNDTLGSGETWSWTPPADANGLIDAFRVRAYAGGEESATDIVVCITVTPVPDPPLIGGTLQGTISNPLSDAFVGDTSAAAAQEIFGLLTITDPDHNKPDPESLTVTITIANDASSYGTFTLPNSSSVSGAASTVYTLANLSPALAQTRLRAARFTPAANVMPVGIYPFDVTVEVRDSTPPTPLQAAPLAGSIHVQSVNDPPLVTASLVPATIPDNNEALPFRLTVSDPDPGDTFSVTVTETTATPRGTLVLPTNPIIGTAAGVGVAMQNVRYQPFQQSSNQTATFEVGVTDVHPDSTSGAAVTAGLSLTVAFVNNPPEFAGITTGLLRTTTDPAAPPVYPFPPSPSAIRIPVSRSP